MHSPLRIQFFHSKGGGPSVFMRRLRRYLVKHYDIQVTDRKPHLYLSAVWRGKPPKGAKTVHRVDNCYFDKLNKNRNRLNDKIKLAIKKANGVIYQSEFSFKLCKNVLGLRASKYVIIHNGFDESLCEDVVQFEHGYKHLFVACALWRPIKRPKSIMRAFRKAEIPDSALVMIGGGIRHPPSDPRIICTGSISPAEAYRYYKAATAVIHISRHESCPNTAVEALAFGKPVICNNSGGTKEIVGNDGVVVDIDPVDKFNSFPMKNPENIDYEKISQAMREVVKKEWDISRPDLKMSTCAKRYMNFFNKILNKK